MKLETLIMRRVFRQGFHLIKGRTRGVSNTLVFEIWYSRNRVLTDVRKKSLGKHVS